MKSETLPHAGGYILSEAKGNRSREQVTIASGQNLRAGAVVGQVTASGEYTELAPGAGTGEEAAAGILFDDVDASAGAKRGVITKRDTEVNANDLVWPDGIAAGEQETAEGELEALGIIIRA